jgi:acyl-coenzyme A synthetase/AMP-(fatty) acid ligase
MLQMNLQAFSLSDDAPNAHGDGHARRLMEALSGKVCCLALRMHTTAYHVSVLLSLILYRINFYLVPSGDRADVPDFCDFYVDLTVKKTGEEIKIERNENFQPHDLFNRDCGHVIFRSSGTTGPSKYVHHVVDRLLDNALLVSSVLPIRENSKILLAVPANHMFGFGVGFLPAVMRGAQVRLIHKPNVIKIIDELKVYAPDVTLVTPMLCKMLLRTSRKRSAGVFISAGDKLSDEIYAEFSAAIGPLVNLYGSTELGAIATSGNAAGGSADVTPLPGVSVSLVGDEIICKHPAGLQGFLMRNERGVWENRGMEDEPLHTGDKGQRVAGQTFKVLGRLNHSVNRAGFLITIQEIESMLEKIFPSPAEVVVVPGHDGLVGKELIAVLYEVNANYGPEQIRAACQRAMPTHLIPESFYVVKDLPRLGSGKPDRQTLLKLYVETKL